MRIGRKRSGRSDQSGRRRGVRHLAVVVAALGVAVMGLPSVASAQVDGSPSGLSDVGLYCNGVKPTWVGTPGNDVYYGTPGDDVIVAGSGNDTIYGGGGHDLICGNDGNDLLFGQGGIDTIYGGAGNDKINGGRSIDMLYGGPGRDLLDGEHGPDVMRGNGGDDVLRGGDHNDDLHGGAGDDRLLGGRGANHCNGGVNVANCDRPPTEQYLTRKGWSVQDQESYGQAAWLRYELARDNVGGPFTEPLSNALFHRLSGITCARCVQLHHEHTSATFTAHFNNLARAVIDRTGQLRLHTPPKFRLEVDSGEMSQARDVWSRDAGSSAFEDFNDAREDMAAANEALGKANEEAGAANDNGDAQGLSNALGDMEQAYRDGADAAARAKAVIDSVIEDDEDDEDDGGDGGGEGDGGRTPGPGCGHHC